MWSDRWNAALRISETFITQTPGIEAYFFENRTVYHEIIERYADERDERCKPMTPATIDLLYHFTFGFIERALHAMRISTNLRGWEEL